MRKLLLLAAIVLSFQDIHSQEIYLQTGKNFTKYDYKSGNDSSPSLQSGSGNFYEIGYIMTLNNENLKYAIGLSLNEYNALGGDINSSYSWDTQYMGIENTFSIAFLNKGGFQASVNGGLGITTLIYGKQNLNGQYLDLSSQKEFSGLWIAPRLGLTASYNVDNDIYLSFGYAYSKSFNVSNSTEEKLSFNNGQIQFGVHFTFR
jgi:hypothetical protein